MTVPEVVGGLRREYERLKAAVDALGDRAVSVKVTEDAPEGWTAKDVLGHLIHYSGQIAFGLGAQLQPPSYVVEERGELTGQQWNERAVAFWADADLDRVWAELGHTVDLVVEQVKSRADEELNAEARNTVPWAPPGPLWQFIGHDTFLHEWPAHADQIEAAASDYRQRPHR